jgi:hypothetical protein
MAWSPPANYVREPNLTRSCAIQPAVGTALFDMVLFRQWTHYWCEEQERRGRSEHLHMSPVNAPKAIDQHIVPPEIYAKVVEPAQMAA